MKSLRTAIITRWKRLKELESHEEIPIWLFMTHMLGGVLAGALVAGLASGMSPYEYWEAVVWIFDLGEWSSLVITLMFALGGCLSIILSFMIGVTHGHFGLPEWTSQLLIIAGAVAFLFAGAVPVTSLLVAIAKLFT